MYASGQLGRQVLRCQNFRTCAWGDMFAQILEEVEKSFSEETLYSSEYNWKDKATYFLSWLSMEMDTVLFTTKAIFSNQVFKYSQINLLYPNKPAPSICTFRISPNNNPFDLAGMNFEASLYAGNPRCPPDVSFELHFWGDQGLHPLKSLYANYRRLIELLFEKIRLEFETDRPIDRVDTYKGKNVIKKLDLYFSEVDDDEPLITLRSEFTKDTMSEDVLKTFLILIAIYDSCYHYSIKPKDIDRIMGYYQKLK